MKILILAAMEKELQLLASLLENHDIRHIVGIELHHGDLSGHEIFVARCGIGKVNSAIGAYKCCMVIKPDLVVNSGVAGGAGLPVGTLLIPDRVAYHDVWCGPGTEYGEAEGYPLFMRPDKNILEKASQLTGEKIKVGGLICSGDKFISTPEEIAFIRSHFPDVNAVDMESASIAQTCMTMEIPFAIIRMVSDTPGEGENVAQYNDFWIKAPQKTFEAVRLIIQSL